MNMHTRRTGRFLRTGIVLGVVVGGVLALGAASASAQNVSCGDTITKDTKLRGDLFDCPGNGIVIGRGRITLDLGGHLIVGTGVGNGVDNSGGYNRVTIKNGTIVDFADGVFLDGANRNRVSGLSVFSNDADGVGLTGSNNNSIEDVVAVANNAAGIRLDGQSKGNGVDDNLTTSNMVFGIVAENGSSNNGITDNAAFRNGQFGIYVDANGSQRNEVERNVASRNLQDGIQVGDATALVKRNTANNNGGFGINAPFGAIDGGGNKAFGNVEPAQCAGVVCS
jgi:parallel beta-helix repeat protein